MDLIQIMKALSDETRVRVLNLLKHGDLCVCELEVLLDINQSNASRHLNKLSNAGIISYYKVTKYVYYKIVESTMLEYPFMKELIEHEVEKLPKCQTDIERLKSYKNSGLSCDDLKEGKVFFEK